MFKKILIAEDIDSINYGIERVLEGIPGVETSHAKYCDEALLKYKKAILDNEPYDLLITDLSFKQDYKEAVLENGEDLIAAIKEIDSGLPILVYSIEDKPYRIKCLFDLYTINAFVLKGRYSSLELREAVSKLNKGEKYISKDIAHYLFTKDTEEITDYDISILGLLAKGCTQSEIANNLETNNITPYSVSAIEKRINKLKTQLKAKNTIQLVALAKDIGMI
ncbi:response regulator [Flavobacterium sp.]|jgi:DNA-binding NarL/FixJ family response regulator|uniref:response regulator n=1 Tax=Flavobacterium sp. TaxID=239 RepID=UPI002A7F1CE0|nr:response regulator [Flavobacterium sp.]